MKKFQFGQALIFPSTPLPVLLCPLAVRRTTLSVRGKKRALACCLSDVYMRNAEWGQSHQLAHLPPGSCISCGYPAKAKPQGVFVEALCLCDQRRSLLQKGCPPTKLSTSRPQVTNRAAVWDLPTVTTAGSFQCSLASGLPSPHLGLCSAC